MDHPHHKDTAASGVTPEATQGGDSTAPLGKLARQNSGVYEGRLHDETHPLLHLWQSHRRPLQPPYVTSSSHINGAFLFEFSHGPWYLDYARTCTVPCACEHRRHRKTVATRARARIAPVRGGPQWFWRHERRQQVGERSRKGEREGKPAKVGTSSSNRDGGGRRKEEGARARGGPAAAMQPGILSAPTTLQREIKQAPPRASQEAPPTDAVSPWRLPTLTRPPP